MNFERTLQIFMCIKFMIDHHNFGILFVMGHHNFGMTAIKVVMFLILFILHEIVLHDATLWAPEEDEFSRIICHQQYYYISIRIRQY